MDIATLLPEVPALVRVRPEGSDPVICLWRGGRLLDLSRSPDPRLHSLDSLLRLPAALVRELLGDATLDRLPAFDVDHLAVLAPCEGQEVWAAGVTYIRSKQARMRESRSRDVYADVYVADRPELFFKAAGWRVQGPGQDVGIRSDSGWDAPEPELAVLCNGRGETIAVAIGNDMSSRSIEGMNPLYLPQAKVYDKSCAIGPAAVLRADVDDRPLAIAMEIRRAGSAVFSGQTTTSDMVRRPSDLARLLVAAYSLPVGAWLLTGTGIVPPEEFSCQPGDEIDIRIEGLGRLVNTVSFIRHSGAAAPVRAVPAQPVRPGTRHRSK